VEQADLVISFHSSVRHDGPGAGLPWACARLSAPDPPGQPSRAPVAQRRTWAGAGAELALPPRADAPPARTRRGRARGDRPGGSRRQAHQGEVRARQLRRSGMFVASQTPRFPAPAGRHGGFTELSCRSSGAKTDTRGVGFCKQVAPPELAPPFRGGRGQPAEGTRPLETSRQEVLQEAVQKRLGRQPARFPTAACSVTATDGDAGGVAGPQPREIPEFLARAPVKKPSRGPTQALQAFAALA